MEKNIDIVIPWVDGSDKAWLEEKNKFSEQINSTVYGHNYREWGLLKYWFRGIEENAPWVRNIYFVTWGHIPDWLNTNNDKLKIVKHEDYIPGEYLPTFSANTIELNFHRIEGLSEKFVYFNDDMYLINKTTVEDFFKNGKPCDSAIINPIAPANNNCIAHMQLTNAAIINQHFKKKKVMRENLFGWFNLKYGSLNLLNLMFSPWGRFPGLLEKHLPSSLLKETYETLWREEKEVLDNTCKHKFRDFKVDVNQWLLKEWQICSGNFEPRSNRFGIFVSIYNIDDAKKTAKIIQGNKYKTLCVNDQLDGSGIDEIMDPVINAFENRFPKKCSFEK